MQRPPSGKWLPLAPTSPIHDIINRVSGKQAELTKLALPAERQTALRAFVDRAFAVSALGLTGLDVSEEQIHALQKEMAIKGPAPSGPERKVHGALASIQVLQSALDRGAPLTPDLLARIHDPFSTTVSPEDQMTASGSTGGDPGRAAGRIAAFCQWAAAESFQELNPLEQAAIMILRLLEIRPFLEGNVAAAIGAGSLSTMRAGWPPIIISKALRPRFNPAVGEGLKMNTRPLVDLLAESLYETLDSMLTFAKR